MIEVREYGASGPLVLVLHGGPGAPGYMAPVARGLADGFRVLEPLQRGDGPNRLTVALHVADLDELIRAHGDARPALVGSSWGAMLALAWAATSPDRAGPLVLVGCGTFDGEARAVLQKTIAERQTPALRRRLAAIERDIADPDERVRRLGEAITPLYTVDALPGPSEMLACSARAYEETWADEVRLQREGVHPQAFAAIRSPVLQLHGAQDPHPGRHVRDALLPHLPQLETVEFDRCGHYPWLERHARDDFFRVLREWLGRQAETDA